MADSQAAVRILAQAMERLSADLVESMRPVFLALHTSSAEAGRQMQGLWLALGEAGEQWAEDTVSDEARWRPGDPVL
jgi:hypothetical protein